MLDTIVYYGVIIRWIYVGEIQLEFGFGITPLIGMDYSWNLWDTAYKQRKLIGYLDFHKWFCDSNMFPYL